MTALAFFSPLRPNATDVHRSSAAPGIPGARPRIASSDRIARDAIAALSVGATASVWYVLGNDWSAGSSSISTQLSVVPPIVTMTILFSAVLLAIRTRLDFWNPKRDAVIMAICGAAAASLAIWTVFSQGDPADWTLATVGILVLSAAVIPAITRMIASCLISAPSVRGRLCRRIAIYGISEHTDKIWRNLTNSSPATEFAGLFEDRHQTRVPKIACSRAGSLSDLEECLRLSLVDEVIIALPRAANARAQDIVERLNAYPVDTFVFAHFAQPGAVKAADRENISVIGDSAFIRVHARTMRGWSGLGKTVLDRAGAAILLILLAPVFAAISVAIKVESQGGVFFRQRRHGLVNEPIVVWKFRTMRVAEDGAVVRQASKDDPRVTRVGRILRKTSLDELPQLINVLRGEMSLVGPRPHAIAHNDYYEKLIGRYNHRHQVKPGITGWAQINGLRGETSDDSLMARRVEADLHYISKWSLWLDFKILLLTPIYGFIGKNAY